MVVHRCDLHYGDLNSTICSASIEECQRADLIVTPFMDARPHGVLAARAPRRPNPIGLSVVELAGISENILEVEDIDILDGTPLLDIKPYVPAFDHQPADRIGWFGQTGQPVAHAVADERFAGPGKSRLDADGS